MKWVPTYLYTWGLCKNRQKQKSKGRFCGFSGKYSKSDTCVVLAKRMSPRMWIKDGDLAVWAQLCVTCVSPLSLIFLQGVWFCDKDFGGGGGGGGALYMQRLGVVAVFWPEAPWEWMGPNGMACEETRWQCWGRNINEIIMLLALIGIEARKN